MDENIPNLDFSKDIVRNEGEFTPLFVDKLKDLASRNEDTVRIIHLLRRIISTPHDNILYDIIEFDAHINLQELSIIKTKYKEYNEELISRLSNFTDDEINTRLRDALDRYFGLDQPAPTIGRNGRPRKRLALGDLPDIKSIQEMKVGPKYPYIYDDQIVVNRRFFHFNSEQFISQINALQADIENTFNPIFEELEKLHVHFDFDYLIFLNEENPNVWAFINKVKPTPGTFRLFQVNTKKENQEYLSAMRRDFLTDKTWSSIGWHDIYSHRESEDNVEDLDNNPELDNGYRRYSGWNKQQLLEAINEVGIFDYSKSKFGNYYGFTFPKLNQIQIENPATLKNDTPNKYFRYIPRYAMETLYTELVDTTVNWDEIFGGGNFPVEAIRKLIKDEFGVVVPGDLSELQIRVNSLLRNRELSSELPNLSQEFILAPGSEINPRVMYTKYMTEENRKRFPITRINIDSYLSEIESICNNPNKSAQDAYEVAVEIGLERYVTTNSNKFDICGVIQRYLDVIRNERII